MDFKDLPVSQKKRVVNEIYQYANSKIKTDDDKRLDNGAETAFLLFFDKDKKATDSMVLGSCPVMEVLAVLNRCSDGLINELVKSAMVGEITKMAIKERTGDVQPYSGAYGKPIPYSTSAFPETDEQSV